ncbi:MAG: hypothetical protein AAB574_02730 [Patescibacteria group bacterium]
MTITDAQMERIRKLTGDMVSDQVARAEAGRARMEEKKVKFAGLVEPGTTTVHLSRRRVPAHLEHVVENPEEVVIGDKRTDWDIKRS